MYQDNEWLEQSERRRSGLPRLPMWGAVTCAFVVAVALAAMVLYSGLQLLDAHGVQTERELTSKTLFDLVKLAFGIVAGAGALVALVVAYRRQRVDEVVAHRGEAAAFREITKLHTDRFTAAVEQLGATAPAVQLGGVHALAGLADDAPTRELRQTCIDVLCAFLRLPYQPDPGDDPAHEQDRHAYRAVREVRHTVIRVIGNHLREGAAVSWQGHDFDFTDVVFDGGDLHGAVCTGGRMSFRNAVFSGGRVDFGRAKISDGMIDFGSATFLRGVLNFWGAEISGGRVHFGDVEISGGRVDFMHAKISDGMIDFPSAKISDGMATFGGAVFSGGRVHFGRATFSGGRVHFGEAVFSGGSVYFGRATFSGGMAYFGEAVFSGGRVHFGDATFSGGSVDFTGASGSPPDGLVPRAGEALPAGVSLPAIWWQQQQP